MTDDIISISRVVQGIVRESHGGGSSVRMPLEMARLIYGSSPRLSIIWITDGEFSDITLSSPMFTLTGELRYADITLIGVGTRSG